MQSYHILYEGQPTFLESLRTFEIQPDTHCLVRIFTAIATEKEAVCIAKEIAQCLPNGLIVGASCSGVIFNAQQYDQSTMVLITTFEDSAISVHRYHWKGRSPQEIAKAVAGDMDSTRVPLAHILCSDYYPDVHLFVEQFNQENSTTRLVGGVLGDVLSIGRNFLFFPDGIYEYGIVTIHFDNPQLQVFTAVNTAHEPISPIYHLTSREGSLVHEIENKPAVEWCQEQFGMKDMTEHEDWQLIAENDALVHFQMILEGHGGASRFIKYDSKAKAMSLYFSQLPSGVAFRIGYTNPTKCVQECYEICSEVAKVPLESIFCYSCLFRKLYLGNCAEWELRPYRDSNICGVFMMGEICYLNGRNEFLNGSCCLVGAGEGEALIQPDFSVFEELYQIKDDSEGLLNFVLKRLSLEVSKENQSLLEKLLEQQECTKSQLYLDASTGLANTIKYGEDNLRLHFNKMCMVQIENAPLLIGHLGQTTYYDIIRQAVTLVQDYTATLPLREHLYFYILNDNTLFVVTNDQVGEQPFMELVQNFYERFQFIKLNTTNQLLINRFVVVINEEDMLERGLSTLLAGRNLQTHFLVSNSNFTEDSELSEEMEMINILNRVIENDGVCPYFQGIYDNTQGAITKYEALMRIQDTDGTIHPPAAFMSIAKKYRLYSLLSKMMLQKIFDAFGGTDVLVSVNLSAHDINFSEMRGWIVSQLEKMGDASNIVVEILEDESFRDMDVLRSFLDEVRKFGVKIAIDDFGSGYSNFMEIARIRPDYIKVDGSIIKHIQSDDLSLKVLENIVFLGRQFNAPLIAEFVESLEIQDLVHSLGIQYSQGYHFSKPQPYAEVFGPVASKSITPPKEKKQRVQVII